MDALQSRFGVTLFVLTVLVAGIALAPAVPLLQRGPAPATAAAAVMLTSGDEHVARAAPFPVEVVEPVAMAMTPGVQDTRRIHAASTAPSPPLTATRWSDWEVLGGYITSAPTVASWGTNRLNVFARGPDATLWHRWWDGIRWSNWQSLGGNLSSAPSCAAWAVNRISCFATQSGGSQIWHKWWDGMRWSEWQDLGGVATSAPTAVAWRNNRISVFVRSNDNQMWHRWWDGESWVPWEPRGGVLASPPSCTSRSVGRIDCFSRGTNGRMYQTAWDGRAWTGWQDLGFELFDAPAATAWSSNRMSVFTRDTFGRMRHTYWNGEIWSPWEDLGAIASIPGCASWGPERIDCFASGSGSANFLVTGAMIHRWWGDF